MEGLPKQFGRYQLLAEIGRGGMAELYLGRLTGLGGFEKLVAIKRMLPHLSQDSQFVDMFLNEGRIAARLAHPNVCQVFELGEVDHELFLAMELLEGISLGDLVAYLPHQPELRLRLAAAVIGQGCDGLAYAHELRDDRGRPTPVVHRDVSPHNLFVTCDGVCKLLDFGVSKVMSDHDQTRSGVIKGKLPYMPPEQVRGEPVDVRADIFAVGVVLWETLVGRRLFVRDSDFLICRAIMEEPIPSIGNDYPAAMDQVIRRALERDREKRWPSMRSFADALRGAAQAVGGAYSPAEVGALVRQYGVDLIAKRSRQVAVATSVSSADELTFPSITYSVELREGAVTLGRRRLPIAIVGLSCGAAAIAVAFAFLFAGQREIPRVAAAPPQTLPPAPIEPVEPTIMVDAPLEPSPEVPAPVKPRASRAHRAPGFYSIDSKPYAIIFVDGKRIDQTPLFHISLPAGHHRIRAVLADGRARTLVVRIDPGKDVTSGTLRW